MGESHYGMGHHHGSHHHGGHHPAHHHPHHPGHHHGHGGWTGGGGWGPYGPAAIAVVEEEDGGGEAVDLESISTEAARETLEGMGLLPQPESAPRMRSQIVAPPERMGTLPPAPKKPCACNEPSARFGEDSPQQPKVNVYFPEEASIFTDSLKVGAGLGLGFFGALVGVSLVTRAVVGR